MATFATHTFHDVEFILIDDGSSDNSEIIAGQYNDPRFLAFHTNNHGLSAARNLGIEQAQGKWLMFVDSDDWVEPDFCWIPFQAALHDEADIVIFHEYKVNQG